MGPAVLSQGIIDYSIEKPQEHTYNSFIYKSHFEFENFDFSDLIMWTKMADESRLAILKANLFKSVCFFENYVILTIILSVIYDVVLLYSVTELGVKNDFIKYIY